MNCSDDLMCPTCRRKRKLYDHVRRYVRKYKDKHVTVYVPRLKCECGIQRVLPQNIVPYKHFEAEVIENVVDEIIYPGDEEIENHPCESTADRWKKWIAGNKTQIDSALAAVNNRYRLFEGSHLNMAVSLLKQLRENYDSWLEIIDKILWNSRLPILNDNELSIYRVKMRKISSGSSPPTLNGVT